MTGLRDSITHVRAATWFAIAVLLTVAGYIGGADALWSLLCLIAFRASRRRASTLQPV